MSTEDDLRAGLRGEGLEMDVDDRLVIGLADQALTQAGRETRMRRLSVVGLAAVAIAGVSVSVIAMHGTSAAVQGPVSSAPGSVRLIGYESACGPGIATDAQTPVFVWDPATAKYTRLPSSPSGMMVIPSPDGKRGLVLEPDRPNGNGPEQLRWAVAGVSDAFKGKNLTFRYLPAYAESAAWSPDGTSVVAEYEASGSEGYQAPDKRVDVYDATTGADHPVAFPAPVETAMKGNGSGPWVLDDWIGDADSLQYVLSSSSGDKLEWIDSQGRTVRAVTLQGGGVQQDRSQPLNVALSPSGRYVMVGQYNKVGVYDLQDQGKETYQFVARDQPDVHMWMGDDEIVTSEDGAYGAIDFTVLDPAGRTVHKATFTPAVSKVPCLSYPAGLSTDPSAFPGAFVITP